MLLFYVVVVRVGSGSWSHLADQARHDWYYLVAILAGFGAQVTLVSELRHRQQLGRGSAVTAGVGTGASTAGMVACCAHHLADALPIVGLSGVAVFLVEFRTPLMLLGIVTNLMGIGVLLRQLVRIRGGYRRVARHGAISV